MRASKRLATVVAGATVALVASAATAAPFEGTVEMKISGTQAQGTSRVLVSTAGVRCEMTLVTPVPFKTAVVLKRSAPDRAFRIDDAAHTYQEIDITAARDQAARRAAAQPPVHYVVKKLGTETLAGVKCQHVLVTGDDGQTQELWTSRDLLDYATFVRAQRPGGLGTSDALEAALREAGADGLPLRSIARKDGQQQTTDVVTIERKAPAAALFEVPAGYKKAEAGFSASIQRMNPDEQEKIRRAAEERKSR